MDHAHAAVEEPDRRRLADAAEGAGEVLVIAQGDDAVEGEHGQRRVGADLGRRLAVRGTGGGHRVDHLAHSQRACVEEGDLPRVHQTRQSDPLLIDGGDVVGAGVQTSAVDAVAEEHAGDAGVVLAQGVLAIARPQAVQVGRLVPEHVVDAHLQRALRAARHRRRDPGERPLLQGKALERQRGVAAAHHLRHALAMVGEDDVGVEGHRLAAPGILQPARQDQPGEPLLGIRVHVR